MSKVMEQDTHRGQLYLVYDLLVKHVKLKDMDIYNISYITPQLHNWY